MPDSLGNWRNCRHLILLYTCMPAHRIIIARLAQCSSDGSSCTLFPKIDTCIISDRRSSDAQMQELMNWSNGHSKFGRTLWNWLIQPQKRQGCYMGASWGVFQAGTGKPCCRSRGRAHRRPHRTPPAMPEVMARIRPRAGGRDTSSN